MPASIGTLTRVSEQFPSGGTVSFTHTPSATPSGILLWVMGYGTVTGATYGGASMDLVASVAVDATYTMRLYKRVSPASGAQTVAISTTDGTWALAASVIDSASDPVESFASGLTADSSGTLIEQTITVPSGRTGVLGLAVVDGQGDTFGGWTSPATGIGTPSQPGRDPIIGTLAGSASAISFGRSYSTTAAGRIAVVLSEPGAVATQLGFGTQPQNTVVGQTMPSFTVRILDAGGNLVNTATDAVTIARQAGTGTLAGTLTRNAVAGVATFNDISLATLNTGATIRATASGLTLADSATFNIVAAGSSGAGGSRVVSRLVQ